MNKIIIKNGHTLTKMREITEDTKKVYETLYEFCVQAEHCCINENSVQHCAWKCQYINSCWEDVDSFIHSRCQNTHNLTLNETNRNVRNT